MPWQVVENITVFKMRARPLNAVYAKSLRLVNTIEYKWAHQKDTKKQIEEEIYHEISIRIYHRFGFGIHHFRRRRFYRSHREED